MCCLFLSECFYIFTDCHVLMGNDEIPELTDIVIRCPKATNLSLILWRITAFSSSDSSINICARAPSEITCKQPQPVPYQNRVTRDNSGGHGSEQYSIRISKILYSESGNYECSDGLEQFDTYNNVRVISKYYFIKTKMYLELILFNNISSETSLIYFEAATSIEYLYSKRKTSKANCDTYTSSH